MKDKLFLLFMFTIMVPQSSNSQNYEAQYAEFGKLNHGIAVLTFNAQSWLYKMSYMLEEHISSDDMYISDDAAESEFDIQLFNYYSFDKKECLWELVATIQKVVVRGSLQDLGWVIHNDSTMEIGGYHCIMAECNLCGWEVKAWFAPEIPVPCGPWRLWGLPGLILKAYSSDGDIDIQMTSLKASSQAPIAPDTSNRKVIAKDEYVNVCSANAKKLARILNNSHERSASADIDVKVKNLDKCFY